MFSSLIHAYQDPHNYIIKAKRALISKGLFLTCLASVFCCMYNINCCITLFFLFGKVPILPLCLCLLKGGS